MKLVTKSLACFVLAIALMSSSFVFAEGDEKAENPCDPTMKKSLYDRLGGINAIAAVVDEFVEVLYVDEILNANPAILAARDNLTKAALKFKVTAMVCQATGGPQIYTGKDMKSAHAHLNISEKDWAQMAADFKMVLDKFEVPEAEQEELFAIVGTTKADIVTAE